MYPRVRLLRGYVAVRVGHIENNGFLYALAVAAVGSVWENAIRHTRYACSYWK